MGQRYVSQLRTIFQKSIESVRPANLFASGKCLKRFESHNGKECLMIYGEPVSVTDKKCHVVGFGKAVLGMAVQLERILGERLTSGIISIPVGTLDKFRDIPDMSLSAASVIKVFEGAQDNLPDSTAMAAAKAIKQLAECMTSNDILFVLISGGGSALLPLPSERVSLQEKSALIRKLARNGAGIEEINIVRIAISQTKGGKLARSARYAHKICSLVISDIVNDPLHLIASGPTVEFKSDGRTPRGILEKYEIWDGIGINLKEALLSESSMSTKSISNSIAHIIGSNKIAANAAVHCAQSLGFKSCLLSTCIVGSLEETVELYTGFLLNFQKYLTGRITECEFSGNYSFEKDSLQQLLIIIRNCEPGDTICLVLAGEPTAFIKGNGKGGRSQELALRMSKACYENEILKNISFLSAGTDGIDGPTDAAGAIGSADVVESFITNHANLRYQDYIDRNDSYNFHRIVESGKYHIVTGHTGTNVMDVHLILIPILQNAA